MRRAGRLLPATATASLAISVTPAGALAKGEPMGVRIDSELSNIRAGQPVDVTFTVLARSTAQHWRDADVWIGKPGSDAAIAYFTARPTGRQGQYSARVTFPTSGQWTYTAGERYGRFFDFAPVTVAPAAGKRSSLLGATSLAGIAFCAALGCAALVRRRAGAG
jgi:hypothetical protein